MTDCQFSYTDENGETFKCKCDSCGFIGRRHTLCRSHQKLIQRDNKLRIKGGLEIPNDLILIVKMSKRQKSLCSKKIDKPIEIKEEDLMIEFPDYSEENCYTDEEWKEIEPVFSEETDLTIDGKEMNIPEN